MRKSDIERRLEEHYRQARLREAPDEEAKARAVACAADEAARRASSVEGRLGVEPARLGMRFARFALDQARYIRTWVWIAQGALLFSLIVGSALSGGAASSALASTVAALTVLVGVPDVLRSREDGVAEIECACRFDDRQALAARMAVLGLSDVVMLTLALLAVPALAGTDPVLVFLHACVPYFVTLAGCLWIAARARADATARCLAFGAGVVATAVLAWQAAPALYAASSAGAWAALFALSLVAMAHEARAYLAAIGAGLDYEAPRA